MTRGLIGVGALLVVALVAGILLGAGPLSDVVSRERPSPTEPPTIRPTIRPTPTRRPTPSPTPVDPAIVASAVVIPVRSADLALPLSGRVAAVFVEPGDEVATGQLLLRLDDSAYRAAEEVAEAELARAEAAVERAGAQLELLPPDADPGERESGEAELRLAEAERDLALSRLAEVQVTIEETRLEAPFDGTVVSVEVSAGEQAIEGETVITIADMSGWLFQTTDVNELEVVQVAVGDGATLTVEALPELNLTGTVERIEARGAGRGGGVRFDVIVRPDRHVPELRWNMSATVRITPGS